MGFSLLHPVSFKHTGMLADYLLQETMLLELLNQAIPALLQAAHDASAGQQQQQPQQQPQAALIGRLEAATGALQAAVAAPPERGGPDRQGLVQPAAALATLLQQYWQLPEQQAAAQLELARAASTRSCAYLACANLGGSGGPAAGEGVGSKKCSVCRVWYCSEACSHADWRAGGHRKVCKALAAERQARKEAAGQ